MLNSKLSSLIVILGPIILILVTGLALRDNSLKSVTASVFSQSPINPGFLEKLEARSFTVINSASLDSCKSSVLKSESDVCIEFVKANSSLNNRDLFDLRLHVDFSRQRTVWSIIGSIQGVVDDESENIRNSLISSLKSSVDSLLSRINNDRRIIDNAKSSLREVDNGLVSISDRKGQIETNLRRVSSNIGIIKSEISNLRSGVNSASLDRIDDLIDDVVRDIDNSNDKLGEIIVGEGVVKLRSSIDSIMDNLDRVDSAINSVVRDLNNIRDADLERLANPIPLTYSSISGSNFESKGQSKLGFIDYLFPSFIMFFLLFASLIYSTTAIIKERSSNAYIRNTISRASGFDFCLGNFITSVFLISVQSAVILLIAGFFVNPLLFSSILSISLIVLIGISVFSLIGMLIGYLLNSQEGAVIASVSLALIFLIFTPIITPSETLPGFMGSFVSKTPLVLLENKLRLVSIFNVPLKFSLSESLSLIGAVLFSIILIWIIYSEKRDREI